MRQHHFYFFLAVFLMFADWSHATVIEFKFSGIFTEWDNPFYTWDSSFPMSHPIVNRNDQFEGYVRFDTENWGWHYVSGNSGPMVITNDSRIELRFGEEGEQPSAWINPIQSYTLNDDFAAISAGGTSTEYGLNYSSPQRYFDTEQELVGALMDLSSWQTIRFHFWTDFNLLGGSFSGEVLDITPIPEPATMLLLGFGLIGLIGYGRKKFADPPSRTQRDLLLCLLSSRKPLGPGGRRLI